MPGASIIKYVRLLIGTVNAHFVFLFARLLLTLTFLPILSFFSFSIPLPLYTLLYSGASQPVEELPLLAHQET
jgi:hypothetical protein